MWIRQIYAHSINSILSTDILKRYVKTFQFATTFTNFNITAHTKRKFIVELNRTTKPIFLKVVRWHGIMQEFCQ